MLYFHEEIKIKVFGKQRQFPTKCLHKCVNSVNEQRRIIPKIEGSIEFEEQSVFCEEWEAF